MSARGARLALVALLLPLAGCGGSDHDDLSAFVAQVRSRPAPPIQAMPDIAAYSPFLYAPGDRRSPFSPPAPVREAANSDIHPDLDRPLDPLEQFPLDSLSLVGTLTSGGVTYALIRAPDGVIHRAARGAHLGRNYGEIDRVGAAGVSLTEIVPDDNGGYRRRTAMLAFPEDKTP